MGVMRWGHSRQFDRSHSVNQCKLQITVLFFQGGALWDLCTRSRDVTLGFDNLSAHDRMFIDVICDNHKLSSFQPFHSVKEITKLTLELVGIQPPAFGPIDCVISWFLFYTC